MPVQGYKAPTNQTIVEPRPPGPVPPTAPSQTCIVAAEFTGTLNPRDRPLGKILGTLADGLKVKIVGRQKYHGRN